MRIGINGRFLMTKQTGVQRAAFNMVSSLIKIDRTNEYILFTGNQELEKADWDYPNVKIISSDLRHGETLRNVIWEQTTLPMLAKKHKVDILHSPANMAPIFYKGKSIVHIHDLCFIVNPQWYSFSFRNWYRFVIPRIVKKATKVITNSNNSRNDLLQYCPLSVDEIVMIYWAVDDSFLRRALEKQNDIDRQRDNYILYVGSLEPRKNIKMLVDAYVLFRKKHPELKTKLVLIGGESPLFANFTLAIKDFKDDVILKGFVDEAVLPEYYRKANMVVYPSLYEGFGLPPLEAMASGTPVITTRSSSLPEVVGNAALTVGPHNTTELYDAIFKLMTNSPLRKDLIMEGYKRVRSFSWNRVAREILATYHQVYYGQSMPFQAWQKLLSITTETECSSYPCGTSKVQMAGRH